MSAQFQALKGAMSSDATVPPPRWGDVLGELLAITHTGPTPEAERALLAALQFGGRLQVVFDDVSELPHGMTPEDMVRSLAAQTLGEWKECHYRPTLRRVAATVRSATLASIIEAVINVASSGNGRRWHAQPVTRLHRQDSSHEVEVEYTWDGRGKVTQYDRGDRVLREETVVVSDFGMTALAPQPSRRVKQTA